ncbi:MAG TPA: Hsp33 family molecular chaperone [Hyphomicrobiaceae bacterium]|nr:Hsp33 family molecular chaperone [Hyphomicrobiaceae bacterium]
MTTQPVNPRAASVGGDDLVLPFSTDKSGISGRLIRLGPAVDTILDRHGYPDAVAEALGEALTLTGLVGTGLKFDGRLILQTRTDGPVGLVVANYDVPGKLRAYAQFDNARAGALQPAGGAALLGNGHMALTIDPGGDMDRYQGIVALDSQTLTEAALGYFRQSEQIPTFIRIAVARHFLDGAWHWRAGGIMLQRIARGGGTDAGRDLTDEERDARLDGEDDEDWTRTRLLAETVEDHELIDPMLTPERLLYRLFHEEGVRAHAPVALVAECRCSRERVHDMLKSFPPSDLVDMREADGSVAVTCEFCSTTYRFAPADIGAD